MSSTRAWLHSSSADGGLASHSRRFEAVGEQRVGQLLEEVDGAGLSAPVGRRAAEEWIADRGDAGIERERGAERRAAGGGVGQQPLALGPGAAAVLVAMPPLANTAAGAPIKATSAAIASA
jgi:hypothetical protein